MSDSQGYEVINPDHIRNVAIIAHVDHGKTTLVDAVMKQSNLFRTNQSEMDQEQILDNNDLEKERGITISAKNISVRYQDTKINIIDTPGHADFGGEVERTLSMAEGCVLVVDAQEGVMPQTRFVLKKALGLGLKPIVVINKIDKKYAQSDVTLGKIQDLFLDIATDESQLDFKTFYAVAKDGKVFAELPADSSVEALEKVEGTVLPLLDAIISDIPSPDVGQDGKLQMQITSLDHDPHYGKFLIGKIASGVAKISKPVVIASPEDEHVPVKGTIKNLYVKEGLAYVEAKEVGAGDIVAIAGIEDAHIGQTVCDPEHVDPLPLIEISPPSLKIRFEANTSPFLGREGEFPNLKQLQARLDREAEQNISLNIKKNDDGSYTVAGRGELHLSILVETLRREGYEFQIRKPEVIITEKEGQKYEPMEEVYIEAPEEYYNVITSEVNKRGATLADISHESELVKVTYHMLTRNVLGLRRLLTPLTKGTVVINTSFHDHVPYQGEIKHERQGRLVSSTQGVSAGYALNSIQDRGQLFISTNVEVYEGMIIGINKYDDDIDVNPTKEREKTNMRATGGAITEIKLKVPMQLTLEFALGFLDSDEILEVTPKNLRLRRKYLNKQAKFLAEKQVSKK